MSSLRELALLAAITKRLKTLQAAFADLSKQPGPAGRDGIDGTNGIDGRDGIDGTHGRDGIDGRDGTNGIDGRDGTNGIDGKAGDKGERGERGEKGDTGPMPKHQWNGTKLRFQQSAGKWGRWVDLAGDKGTVIVGGGGGASFDASHLVAADDVMPEAFIVMQSGRLVRASYAQMSAWFPSSGGSGVPANAVTVNGSAVTVNGEVVTVD